MGDTVKEGICVIEAMKLFNDIESDISGKIVKVLVDDASLLSSISHCFLVDHQIIVW